MAFLLFKWLVKGFDSLWGTEFYNNDPDPSKKRVQDIRLSHIKLKVSDTYRKDEKLSTSFEPSKFEDVVIEAYHNKKRSQIESSIWFIEKNSIEFKLHTKKQSLEEILIGKSVKTAIQILYDLGLFERYANADEILKDFLFTEVKERQRPSLQELNSEYVSE